MVYVNRTLGTDLHLIAYLLTIPTFFDILIIFGIIFILILNFNLIALNF